MDTASSMKIVGPDMVKFSGGLSYEAPAEDSDKEPDITPELAGQVKGTRMVLLVDVELTQVAYNSQGEVVTAKVLGAERIQDGNAELARSLCVDDDSDPGDTDGPGRKTVVLHDIGT